MLKLLILVKQKFPVHANDEPSFFARCSRSPSSPHVLIYELESWEGLER